MMLRLMSDVNNNPLVGRGPCPAASPLAGFPHLPLTVDSIAETSLRRPRVFRSIWRINAVMILVIGLLSLGLFAFVAYEALKERFQSLHRNDLVNVDPRVHIDSNWELGSFEHIAGTNVAAAPVHSSQRFRLAVREKDAEAVRNYLFLDLYDKSSRWLLPNHDRLILNKREICGATSEKGWQSCREVAWLAFESVTADTDGDHRLSSKGRLTLGFSNPDGGNY